MDNVPETIELICECCGLIYQRKRQRGNPPKWCKNCKEIVRKDKEIIYGLRKREARKIKEQSERRKSLCTLDATLAECRENGISFAEQQKAKTLALVNPIIPFI